jgi:hypothetical protein
MYVEANVKERDWTNKLGTVVVMTIFAFACDRGKDASSSDVTTAVAEPTASATTGTFDVVQAAKDVNVLQKETREGKTVGGIDPKDAPFVQFGTILQTVGTTRNFYNPHSTAAYAAGKCIAGEVDALLNEMPHVESDPALGTSLGNFVKEFCPDLKRYNRQAVTLKFAGYRQRETTSVWYYYVTDAAGHELKGRPWLSIHRSKRDGRAALTGIFLPEGDEIVDPLPGDVITERPAA